jgi:hypothetical protein
MLVNGVFLVLVLANLAVNLRGQMLRRQPMEDYQTRGAEIDARIKEAQSTLAEATEFRRQLADLRTQKAQLVGKKSPAASGAVDNSKTSTP